MKLSSAITISLLATLAPSLAFPISFNQAAVTELAHVKRAMTSFREALSAKRSPSVSISSALAGLSESSTSSHQIDSNWAHEPDNQVFTKRSAETSREGALADLSGGSGHQIDSNWAHEPDNQLFAKRSSASTPAA